jgi:hypothetical protein
VSHRSSYTRLDFCGSPAFELPSAAPTNECILRAITVFKSLKELKITHVGGAFHTFGLAQQFSESLIRLLFTLDTALLEVLGVKFTNVDDPLLRRICRANGGMNWCKLEEVLAGKVSRGQLDRLKEVKIQLGVNRTEHHWNWAGAMKEAKEAAILLKLKPTGLRRITLESKLGKVMYDSK